MVDQAYDRALLEASKEAEKVGRISKRSWSGILELIRNQLSKFLLHNVNRDGQLSADLV